MSDTTKRPSGVTVKIVFHGTTRNHAIELVDPAKYAFLAELEADYIRKTNILLDEVKEVAQSGSASEVLPVTYKLKLQADHLKAVQDALSYLELNEEAKAQL